MSKKRTSALFLTVGTAIALTAGGAAAYWFLRQRGTGGDRLSSSAVIIPQSALATFSISTNGRQWQQVRSLGTLETQAKFNQQLAQWRDRLIEDSGLDYSQDIQPWIGDKLTVALLPPDVDITLPNPSSDANGKEDGDESEGTGESDLESFTDTEDPETNSDPSSDQANAGDDDLDSPLAIDPELIDPTQEQRPILVLPIADPLKARSRLKAALGDESNSVKRDYNGVEIQELSTQSDFKFATVLDRQTLVLTQDAATIEQVVDTYTGESSIVDTPGYRQALSKIASPQSFMDVYVNSAAAATLAAANTVQATPPQGLAALKDGQGVAASVTLNGSGFDMKGVTWLKQDAENPYKRGKAVGTVLEKLPQDTLIMAAGSSFKQLWDAIDQRSTEGIKGPLNPQTVRSGFQSLTGLDIDTDLIDWMTGDFALALVLAPETEVAPASAGVVLMAETGDRATAEKTFAELDTVVKDRYRFTVTPNTLGDVAVTQWSSPFAALTLTRGWLADNTSFLSIGNIAENLVPKPSTALANNPLFQQVTTADVGTVNGYFFVDIESLLGAKSALPIPPLPAQQAATVGAIRAIGVMTTIESEQTAQFNVSVVMPKLDNPGTLPEVSELESSDEDEDAPDTQ